MLWCVLYFGYISQCFYQKKHILRTLAVIPHGLHANASVSQREHKAWSGSGVPLLGSCVEDGPCSVLCGVHLSHVTIVPPCGCQSC